ncbi:hypothetical protein BT63DRAFT_428577 [Microthyrium microscopicum]|uniref:Monopolin complex subunit Csm1/Pcs1 C-terminal domain-containing protein n=1 Tax=Microthyrium microscopicum TaxID=703497 RepID=A0A6A6U2H9_9PEZI|nr:hypothetical protein BT63DRAFT_428577 [Microthyrium microscopicum]
MPPRKPKAHISALVDLSDDELGYTQTVMAADPVKPTGTRRRSPARAVKAEILEKSTTATKSKAKAAAEPKARRNNKRAALDDVTNTANTEDTADDVAAPPKKRAKNAPKAAAKGRKKAVPEPEPVEVEDSEQMDLTAAESTEVAVSVEEVVAPLPQISSSRPVPVARARSRSASVVREHIPSSARRNGGAAGDAAVRRKLGDLSSKYDGLELRYNSLRDIATVEAQTNFEKLKTATEKQTKAQNELIASLRKQIASQKDFITEASNLRKQLSTSQSQYEKLSNETKVLAEQNDSLKQSNTKSQNDIKALQAKLASARAQAESAQNAKGPANKTTATPNALSGKLNGNEMLALKEDLYCDVTGLIIHSVKRTDEGTIYDCSQTGRNGTLRFTLNFREKPATTPGTSVYDEPEITYTPILDEKNDKHLLDILEDYLLEEIEFPQNNLQRLYTTIRDGMTKKVVMVDEEDDDDDDE